MAFIGNTYTTQGFTPAVDYFSGNGSTTAFTLSRPVASVAQVEVYVANVPQTPNTAYSVSGNTITFTSAPLSGTNNIYVYYTSPITQVIAPGQGTVQTAQLGNITNIASGNSSLTLQTGTTPTTAVTIDTSQRVGVGTTSPGNIFDVNGALRSVASSLASSGAGVEVDYGGAGTGIGRVLSYDRTGGTFKQLNFQGQPLVFVNGSSEAMRIDTSGNVGIGTTSPGFKLDVRGAISTGYSSGQGVYYQNLDGTNNYEIYNAGATGSGNPILSFYQTGVGERMRIDSSGNVLIGKTSASATLDVKTATNQQVGRFSLAASSSQATPGVVIAKQDNTTTTSQVFVQFLINSEGSGSGQINANGASAAAFGSYSDSRLKENIVDLPPQLANIMALRPAEFDYIESEGGGHQIGFIAQEMETVYPDVVGERSDGMKTITGWSKTEARLVKALQELKQIVDAQAAEIAALKTKVGG